MARHPSHRMQQFGLVVGAVALAASLGVTPASGVEPSDDEPVPAPIEIVELELGEIRETVGPRVSPAYRGSGDNTVASTDEPSPLAGRPEALGGLGTAFESVIGADGRIQQTVTTEYPHRAIGQLEIVEDGSLYYCTGWMIDRNSILTAAHCAYNVDGGTNDPIESATFTPGRNGSGVRPYSYCWVNGMYAPYGWRANEEMTHDWAVMHLNCNVGDTVGWFGLFSLPGTNRFAGSRGRVQGYPTDKPLGTQWKMAGDMHHSTDRQVFYPMDTFGGQSGAPVFKWNRPSCGGPCGLGIHTYGVGGDTPTLNRGTRLTASVFDKIIQVRAQNG
ncbi:MAG TPA: trypsin-like serine protease [Acidimicrobiales bacterium]|nr:trypsin-like serine protease [Acidimicrobiales bacterium]